VNSAALAYVPASSDSLVKLVNSTSRRLVILYGGQGVLTEVWVANWNAYWPASTW